MTPRFEDTLPDPGFPASGLPQDRTARLAARRAFVDMKLIFMRATEPLEGRKADWLRHQVRRAHDPLELWLLRGPVLSALSEDEQRHRDRRAELYRMLDRLFPEAFGFEPDASLPSAVLASWESHVAPVSQLHTTAWS